MATKPDTTANTIERFLGSKLAVGIGFLSLGPSQIVLLVDALEREGLVERTADPNDRRSKVITGTKAGEQLYTKARKATSEGEAAAMERLSEAEQETLRDLLSRIAFRD